MTTTTPLSPTSLETKCSTTPSPSPRKPRNRQTRFPNLGIRYLSVTSLRVLKELSSGAPRRAVSIAHNIGVSNDLIVATLLRMSKNGHVTIIRNAHLNAIHRYCLTDAGRELLSQAYLYATGEKLSDAR